MTPAADTGAVQLLLALQDLISLHHRADVLPCKMFNGLACLCQCVLPLSLLLLLLLHTLSLQLLHPLLMLSCLLIQLMLKCSLACSMLLQQGVTLCLKLLLQLCCCNAIRALEWAASRRRLRAAMVM